MHRVRIRCQKPRLKQQKEPVGALGPERVRKWGGDETNDSGFWIWQ